MKIVRYWSPKADAPRIGIIGADMIQGNSKFSSTLENIIRDYGKLPLVLRAEILNKIDEEIPLADAHLLAPIEQPPSFRDFMAFEKHVVQGSRAAGGEIDPMWYEAPVFYFSNPHVLHGPYDEIKVPQVTEMFDLELELAAVVCRDGSNLDASEAENIIAGYVLLADWSLRDVQARERRIGLGPVKAKDSATSLGSVFVTPDELEGLRKGNGYDVTLSARINGELLTSGSWADIHWSFGELIAYASRDSKVRAGDLIGSGTVGGGCMLEYASQPFTQSTWLRVGDLVELDGGPLGEIRAHLG